MTFFNPLFVNIYISDIFLTFLAYLHKDHYAIEQDTKKSLGDIRKKPAYYAFEGSPDPITPEMDSIEKEKNAYDKDNNNPDLPFHTSKGINPIHMHPISRHIISDPT